VNATPYDFVKNFIQFVDVYVIVSCQISSYSAPGAVHATGCKVASIHCWKKEKVWENQFVLVCGGIVSE
jgi:hypothetical protein